MHVEFDKQRVKFHDHDLDAEKFHDFLLNVLLGKDGFDIVPPKSMIRSTSISPIWKELIQAGCEGADQPIPPSGTVEVTPGQNASVLNGSGSDQQKGEPNTDSILKESRSDQENAEPDVLSSSGGLASDRQRGNPIVQSLNLPMKALIHPQSWSTSCLMRTRSSSGNLFRERDRNQRHWK